MRPRFLPVVLCVFVSLNVAHLPLAYAEAVATSTTATTTVSSTTTPLNTVSNPTADSAVISTTSATSTTAAVSATSAILPRADSPDPTTLENSQATAQTRDQIAKIVFADDFSKQVQNKHWQRKHPLDLPEIKRQPARQSNSNIAEIVGLILKIIALLALLAGVIWIAKNAATWLAWFKGTKGRRAISQPDAEIANHYRQAFAPIWQGLPEKSRLSQFVKEAVTKGDWLLALSTLYRGTLREMVDIYDLPITRATTERQGEWLLQQAKANSQEATFFQQLIEIWANVAYGQQRPNSEQVAPFSQTIHQLAITWDSLYLHRQSALEKRHLEKRYQPLEQPPTNASNAKKAKKAGGNA